MIILIGGVSHTGKTYMAQKLLEKYKIPYLSLDHLKMGLFRGGLPCGFSILDKDEVIAEALWPVVEGIIRTNIENDQQIIIEGCYLPPQRVRKLKDEFPLDIIEVYICFTEAYLVSNFDTQILRHRRVIEKRIEDEDRSIDDFVREHKKMRHLCVENNLKVFDVNSGYEERMDDVMRYIDSQK